MNNELIERIDEVTNNWGSVSSFKASGVLIDCKAEIERLLLANETLKELNVEYLERVKLLETEAWRNSKAREYVPMTDDELISLLGKSQIYNQYSGWALEREVERAVIKRLGLVWGEQ